MHRVDAVVCDRSALEHFFNETSNKFLSPGKLVFLAVQDSSIGDIVSESLSQTFDFSNP